MKAKELMIGDWLYVNGLTQQVFDLAYNQNEKELTIGVLDPQGDVYQCFYGFDYVEPIPLTAEILKKNGWIVWKANKMGVLIFTQHFEFSDNLLGIEDSIEIRIDCDPYGDFHYMCNGESFCYVNHVHELQHALRLCGIEKYIQL